MFFKRLFGDENKKEIVIEQVEAPIVQMLIDFAYQGAAAIDLAAHAIELYDAARILGIETLRVSHTARSLHRQGKLSFIDSVCRPAENEKCR